VQLRRSEYDCAKPVLSATVQAGDPTSMDLSLLRNACCQFANADGSPLFAIFFHSTSTTVSPCEKRKELCQPAGSLMAQGPKFFFADEIPYGELVNVRACKR